MKKIYLLTLVLGLATTSCNDWFDVIPRTSVYEEDLYKNETGFQQVLTGLYIGMGQESLYGKETSFGMTDVVSGIYHIPKTSNNAYKYALQYNYEYSSTKGTITNIWNTAYNIIANANELLRNAGIRQDVAPQETAENTESNAFASGQTRNIICGEALALRAYLHLDLVRMFGMSPQQNADKPAIPYVTVLQKNITPQSSVKEVMQSVITDLLQAEQLLRDADPIVKGNPTLSDTYYKPVSRHAHLNYYAVCGLLARAYQYEGNDEEAGKWAEKVITSNAFSWTKTSALNNGDYVGTSELVFGLFIRNMKDQAAPYFRYNTENENASALMPISEATYNEYFGANDKRRKGFLMFQGSYLSQKFVVTESDVADSLSVQHWMPMLRLSEMYYIATESLLAANNVDDAADELNLARKAKGLKAVAYASAAEVREELNKEYFREFMSEGQLFYYIKRRNQPNLIATQFKVDFVFPLPENEYTYGNRQANK